MVAGLECGVSRRLFLGAGVAAVASAVVGRLEAAEEVKGGFIDAHSHIWTPDTKAYPLAPGVKAEEMKPTSFTAEELLAQCRPQGVDRVVLIQMIFYGTDNRYMLDAIAKRPETFRGVAVIDEKRADLRKEMRRLKGQGVRGFRLYTSRAAAESWADADAMKAMWACGADEGLAMCLLADPEALPAVRTMCERFPETPVVIDHFARIGMRGPARPEDAENLCRLAEFPRTFVKTSAFYALGGKKAPYADMGPLVRRLRDVFGAKRLIWASDCPYQVQEGHTYADSIALIRDRLDFLTAEDKAWMLGKTAEGVFFG
jgi:predicted TIM-barrel fold metal-dependent hydrolase